MTKQNKNRKEQATLDEMVKSGSQLILMHDDGTEQPIEQIAQADPYAGEVHYKSWWNQFVSLEISGSTTKKCAWNLWFGFIIILSEKIFSTPNKIHICFSMSSKKLKYTPSCAIK